MGFIVLFYGYTNIEEGFLEVSNLSPRVKPSGSLASSNILSMLVTLEVSNLSPKVKPSGI